MSCAWRVVKLPSHMRKDLAAFGVMVAACLGFATKAHAADCSAAKSAAARVNTQRQALLALPLTNKSGDVPPAAQQAIAAMKAALADFIGAQVRCSDVAVAPENLHEALSESTNATEDEDSEGDAASPDAAKYGYALIYEVKRWPANPKLISVSAGFSIECSVDTLLSVYDSSGGNWTEVMRWQAEPFDKVNGAFFSLDYQISPPDSSGRWYALAKRIAPACATTWSTIDYAVLRPQSGKTAPRELYRAQRAIWWGGDDYGELNANASDFEVRFHGKTLDSSISVRPWVEHYVLAGDAIKERSAPIALTPVDFVDEWLREPWDEALRWSDPKAKNALREVHDRWQKSALKYESLRRCESGSRYEVAVSRDDGAKAAFAVAGQGAFSLVSAQDGGMLCKGADLPLR